MRFEALLGGLLVGAMLVPIAQARSRRAARPVTLKSIRAEVDQLRKKLFPALRGFRVEVTEFESKDYYLATAIRKKLRSAKKRIYQIRINPGLLAAPPPPAALRAILVHELYHVLDYTRLSAVGLAKMGVSYLVRGARYERYTDCRALTRGYAKGLRQYRAWIYKKLDNKGLRRKKRRYFTPAQIDTWVRRPRRCRK